MYTADRWVASARLDVSVAGSYGLASLIASAVFLVPMVIAQQQYPRLAMSYGAGASPEQLRAAARQQSLVAASASLVTALGVAAFGVLVVPIILPAYEAVVGPLVVLSFGITALAGSTGYANLMVVVGAQWAYLAILVFSLGVAGGFMWLGSAVGGGLGLAAGVAIGQAAMMFAVMLAVRLLVTSARLAR
jgi:O-antigen/teichoic acid export membrane protein